MADATAGVNPTPPAIAYSLGARGIRYTPRSPAVSKLILVPEPEVDVEVTLDETTVSIAPPAPEEPAAAPAPPAPPPPRERIATSEEAPIPLAVPRPAPAPARATPSGGNAMEALRTLLQWTAQLDQTLSVQLWVAASEAATEDELLGALARWVERAGVAVPLGLKVRDLAVAAGSLLRELAQIEHDGTRLARFPEPERTGLARALRAWALTRDVLLQRKLARSDTNRAIEQLMLLAQRAPDAPDLGAEGERALDFVLLVSELRGESPIELASLAVTTAGLEDLRGGPRHIGRPALRAMRLLGVLAQTPDVAERLPPQARQAVTAALVTGLEHPRFAVWSRAARALGQLVGPVPELGDTLRALLEPAVPTTLRRRAHAALASITAEAARELRERFAQLWTAPPEPWVVASMVVALPLWVDEERTWLGRARHAAAKGGPEAWAMLLVMLREIAGRYPTDAPLARRFALEVRALAEGVRNAAPADAEMIERALALSSRVVDGEGNAELTPGALVQELASQLAQAPEAEGHFAAIEELGTHCEHAITGALKAVTQDNPRTVSRAITSLDEAVDLLVDGDLLVVVERLHTEPSRGSALSFYEHLRTRLLRAVWTGLRRPSPTAVGWRRWLLRSAALLPSVEPVAPEPARVVRDQVFDTLARLSDDSNVASPALQRNVVSAFLDLSRALAPTAHAPQLVAVLSWMALRGGPMPLVARLRREVDDVTSEHLSKLYRVLEMAQRANLNTEELGGLSALVGPRTALGRSLSGMLKHLAAVSGKGPEAHWSGLPRLDLQELGLACDRLRRVRDEVALALSERPVPEATPGESLGERAAKITRSLTTTSMKFVDATRRTELIEHYLGELTALTEAMATACGPVAGVTVRAHLARALVAVRTLAAEAVAASAGEDVRYVGRIRVLGPLASGAEGGMATTFLAEGPCPGKRVVLKMVPWEQLGGGNAQGSVSARALFEKEMQRLAAITHPNVVSIVDAGFVEEGAYIAIEYIPGASLETMLRATGTVDLRFLAPVVRDTARGLAYMHAHGIVHRDIKPGNILVQLEGHEGGQKGKSLQSAEFVRAVVIDLGIASAEDERVGEDEGLTGTPGYMAPEIARGLNVYAPAVDVYALAVVIFEALTGRNPYLDDADDITTVLVRHGTMPLPVSDLLNQGVRPAVLQLLGEAGRLDPRERPTMKEFLERWNTATR